MANQSVYTSVPQGLWSGAGGYATVLSTEAIPRALAEFMEGLSTYSIRDQYKGETVSATQKNYELLSSINPPSVSYFQFKYRGDNIRVLARTCLAGFDYSKRLRKLSHFLVLTPNDLTDAGPAWLASQEGIFLINWGGTPTLLREEKTLPKGQLKPSKCPTWQAKTGDAGWAGALAKTALDPQTKNVYLVVSNPAEVMPLFMEATSLLPATRRWNCTFSTLYAELPLSVECKWRGIVAGTPEHRALGSVRNAIVIDTTKQLPSLEPSLEVACARGGREIPEQVIARTDSPRLVEPEFDYISAYVEQPQKKATTPEITPPPALLAPPNLAERVERVPQYPAKPATEDTPSFSVNKLLLLLLVICMPVVGLITLTSMYAKYFPVTLAANQQGTIDLGTRKTPDFDVRDYVQGNGDLPLQVTMKTVSQSIDQRQGELWKVGISPAGVTTIELLNSEFQRLPQGSKASLAIDLSVRVNGKPSNELPLRFELTKQGVNDPPYASKKPGTIVVNLRPNQFEEKIDVLSREGWKDIDKGAKLRVSEVHPEPPLSRDYLSIINNNQIHIHLPGDFKREPDVKYKVRYEVMDEVGAHGTSEFAIRLLPYPPAPMLKDLHLYADSHKSFTLQQLIEDPKQDLQDWEPLFGENQEPSQVATTDLGGTVELVASDQSWSYSPPPTLPPAFPPPVAVPAAALPSVALLPAASSPTATVADGISVSLRHKLYKELATQRKRISFDKFSVLESIIAQLPKPSAPNFDYLPRISFPEKLEEVQTTNLLELPPPAAELFDKIKLESPFKLNAYAMIIQRDKSRDPRIQAQSLFLDSKQVLSLLKQGDGKVYLQFVSPAERRTSDAIADPRELLAGWLIEIPSLNAADDRASIPKKILQVQFEPPRRQSKQLSKADIAKWEIPLDLPNNLDPELLAVIPRSELKVGLSSIVIYIDEAGSKLKAKLEPNVQIKDFQVYPEFDLALKLDSGGVLALREYREAPPSESPTDIQQGITPKQGETSGPQPNPLREISPTQTKSTLQEKPKAMNPPREKRENKNKERSF